MASQGAFLGDSVILCGHPKGDITSYQRGGGKAQLTIAKSWKAGSAVGHLGWREDYFVRSPGLIVDIGCPPGYSGGPVFIQSKLLESPLLVGIISSSDEYQTKASMIWPALPLNHMMKHDGSVPNSVLGLFPMKDAITGVSNGASHIIIIASALMLKGHITWND